ncbi:MAG: hypothetical protein QOE45_3432 [Frankiaceae bacterium]|jgi:hypothetical protein|nr:hypothetical protein [Frankiaceae bacterium]
MARTAIRLALAGAFVAAGLAPGVANAGDPPPSTFCTVHWRPMYIFTDDVPVTLYQPYMVC